MRCWIMRILGFVPEPERCRFCGRMPKDCPYKRRIDEVLK